MHKMINGKVVEIHASEAAEIQAEWGANIAEQAATQYKRDRKAEFPSVEDQLDMIYWDRVNNTNEWQSLIESIKTKYPKP